MVIIMISAGSGDNDCANCLPDRVMHRTHISTLNALHRVPLSLHVCWRTSVYYYKLPLTRGTYWYQHVAATTISLEPRAKLMTLKLTLGKAACRQQPQQQMSGAFINLTKSKA
jgi:hypothetical protein